MRTLLALLLSFSLSAQVYDDAVGWGADWTFPASYEVFIVDTTSDNSADGNTLREGFTTAISANARIIVFNGLSGTITLNSPIAFTQDNKPIYVAGQTAGANGIVITAASGSNASHLIAIGDFNNQLQTESAIIRGLTFAMNDTGTTQGDSFNIFSGDNILIDQCTFLWGYDENFSIVGAVDVTVQRSIIAESLLYVPGTTTVKPGGTLVSSDINRVSFYRNIWAWNNTRNPAIGGASPNPPANNSDFELVQNIVYGWSKAGQGMGTGVRTDKPVWNTNVSLINNLGIRASYTSSTRYHFTVDCGTNGSNHVFYLKDNWEDIFRTSASQPQNDCLACSGTSGGGEYAGVPAPAQYYTTTPFGFPLDGVVTLDQQTLLDAVTGVAGDLNDPGGMTTAITTAVRSGAGGVITSPSQSVTGGFPVISATPLIVDTDNDGIPDSDEATWGNDTFGYVNALAGSGAPPTQAGPLSRSVKQTSAMLIAH